MKKKICVDDLIPSDLYCHGNLTYEDGKLRAEYLCPFWKKIPGRPKQENGYCLYMQKGDWANSMGGMGLLWDQCKECGLKMDIDWDSMETFAEIDDSLVKVTPTGNVTRLKVPEPSVALFEMVPMEAPTGKIYKLNIPKVDDE